MIELDSQEISFLERKGLLKRAVAKTEYCRNVGTLKFYGEDGKEIPNERIVRLPHSPLYYYVTGDFEKFREQEERMREQKEREERALEEERKKKLLEMWEKAVELSKNLPKPKRSKEGNEKKFLRWLENVIKETKEYHELLNKLFANQITLREFGLDVDALPRYGLTRQYVRPITYGYVYYWDPEVKKYLIIAKIYYDVRGDPGISSGKFIFKYSDSPHPSSLQLKTEVS